MSKSEGQKQSQKHEKRLAKKLGGSRTAASGAFWSRKGDVRTDLYLIEHKWTGKKSFTLKSAVLKKVFAEAVMDGREPVLGVHLDGVDYVIIEEHLFHEFIDTIKNLHEMQNNASSNSGKLHETEESS